MPPLQRTRSKPKHQQTKLSFATPSANARPLALSPAFSLPGPSGSTLAPAPPPVPSTLHSSIRHVQGKGKEKQIDPTSEPPKEPGLWVDEYHPINKAQLAVHARKVQDVERWILEALRGSSSMKKHRRLLVLTGPSGSGKTATIKTLAHHTNADFELVEWQNESPSSNPEQWIPNSSFSDRLTDFLARAARFPSLNLSATSSVFSDRSKHASNSATELGSNRSGQDARKRVILIDDLPNIHHLATKDAFQAAILQFLSRPLPRASSVTESDLDNVPIVVILTESTPRDDDERWAGDSGGNAWRERLNAIMDVRTTFSDEIRRHPGYAEIRFNPVAPTILLKALRGILDLRFPSPSKLKRSSSGSDPRSESAGEKAKPPPELVNAIAEQGTGDIRAAINCLQFMSIQQFDGIDDKRLGKRDARGKRKENLKPRDLNRLLSLLSGRESSLALFHAVGRVLYNKRLGDPGVDKDKTTTKTRTSFSTDDSDGDDSNASRDESLEMASLRNRLDAAKKALFRGEERIAWPEKLPMHMNHLERRKSRVDVQALWTDMPVEPGMFQLYIHHNFPAFASEIEQCSEISDWFSCADSIRPEREEYRNGPLVSYYQFLTSVHATLLHLPSPIPRTGQKLSKAAFWEVGRKIRETNNLIDDAKQWLAEGLMGKRSVLANAAHFGARFGASWTEDGLDVNRSDASGGQEDYSSLVRADRQSLATEIIPMLCKIGSSSGGTRKVPRYFEKVARLRFDWAGTSEMADRKLDEHEIELHGDDEDDEADLDGLNANKAGAHADASSVGGAWEGAEKMYLSDDDIAEF